MKRIEAIIREESLEAVKSALEALGADSGILDMTLCHCRSHGAQGGINLEWRAGTYRVDFLHRLMLILVVQDQAVPLITNAIVSACRTDEAGCDGTILVSSVETRIQICAEKKD